MSVAELPAIAVHGGAWGIPDSLAGPSVEGVQRATRAGYDVLTEGGSALDAVVAAICILEDDPVFDAGQNVFFIVYFNANNVGRSK